ncbi:hypothetical protein TcWFU_003638 [Taenia crassiceps]|uniref:GPS domain-containing protein n=1 Tax=Taenia crassiceps TaxID=6207 RepID=A0ABR4QKP7_9CEST
MRFSIEATMPFHGTVEVNGTNFQGTFKHTCQLNGGLCLVNVSDRVIRTGEHRVCAKAVARDGHFADSCLAVSITLGQGKIELYVVGGGAPLNGATILRTRPVFGGYDPRLSYSLLFGDGSPPVNGSGLDALTSFDHNYTREGKFTASMEFGNGDRITCEVKVAHPIEEFHVAFPNGPIALVGKPINASVWVVSAGPVSVKIEEELRYFTLLPATENMFRINATAYNLGFSKTIPVVYQGQLNNFDIRIHLRQALSTTLRFSAAFEVLNYSSSHSVPLGFRIIVECSPAKGGSAIAKLVQIHEKEKTFQFSLPPLGQFKCMFMGQNDVWRTKPKSYTVVAAIPLILGGIGISTKVDGQTVTGCGRYRNVFERYASITLSVDVIKGNTEEVQWYLKNLDTSTTGSYTVMAIANGPGNISCQSMGSFLIVDIGELLDYCKEHPSQLLDPHSPKWPFAATRSIRLRFQILEETGTFHRVQWKEQKICLSPRLIDDPHLKSKQNKASFTIGSFYMSLTLPMHRGTIEVEEEDGDICLPLAVLEANNLYKATIYVNDSLMIDREVHKILLEGGMAVHFSARIVRPVSAIKTHSLTSFEHIVLSGACEGLDCFQAAKSQWYVEAVYLNGSSWLLNDEQMTRFTQVKTGDDEITISVSKKPAFFSILPRIGRVLQTCIRSLPESTVYINTCFQSVEFVPVTQEDLRNLLQSITSEGLGILDDIAVSGLPNVISETVQAVSAQVATLIRSNFSEDAPEPFNHKRNQVAKSLDKLATVLSRIPVTDYESLLSVTSTIEAVVANAKEMAFPTIERIQSGLAEVAKALPDILPLSSRDNTIKFSRRFLRIGLYLLEGLSYQYANPTPFLRERAPQTLDYDTDINSQTQNDIDQLITGSVQADQRKTASSLRRNFYDYLNRDQFAPQSNLIALTLFVNGTAINAANTSSAFVFTLKKNKSGSSTSNSSIGIVEQYLTLPEPVVAVDGSLVYQPLILHSFNIGETEGTFVLQLHPADIDACPQYLVVARFAGPPMLGFDDGLGHFLWTMIPSTTLKCKPNENGEEALLNYAYYIDAEMLAELKAEALKHTAHIRLRAEELNVLHIGYRQLTGNELDRYDDETPPPAPYPYTDQINNTVYLSAFMASCLHTSPGDDEWRQDGCEVLPSSAPDEVTCKCTHLTTFGTAILHVSPSTDPPFIIDRSDLMHFSIGLTTTNFLPTFACILTWRITGRICECYNHRPRLVPALARFQDVPNSPILQNSLVGAVDSTAMLRRELLPNYNKEIDAAKHPAPCRPGC